ncbi:MFS transporter [Actinoplanes sp. NPDC089786]|uniref:MFS transporter n=1 Tax=Actinoplanes sp. NPDC089786 TaxID=3155185 RepID=UPI00341AC8C4
MSSTAAETTTPVLDPHRWLALAVIATSTLMVVLDSSIVTIALPDAQSELGISDTDRQWIVTAYGLAFGGLLLVGGKIADHFGRKRMFLVGLAGFAAASALGGAADGQQMLIVARALQGAFAAVLAPAALSMLVVTFTDERERAKAFGVYGAVQGAGGALGLVAGGLLTEYVDWRWCLYVNVPIGVVVGLVAIPLLAHSRPDRTHGHDVLGAVLASGGLAVLVFGFTRAADPRAGWLDGSTIAILAAALILLGAFALVESRVRHPMLPLRVILHRDRGGALLGQLLIFSGIFGLFLFLTFYFQVNLGYTPVRAGLAFLPFSAGIVLTAALASTLMSRFGAKKILVTGTAVAVAGLLWLTRLDTAGGFIDVVLPAEIVMSIGIGLVLVPATALALAGVRPGDAGVASALVNTTQQVGGALGTALLNTLYVGAVARYVSTHGGQTALEAQLHGYRVAFLAGAALLALALGIFATLIRRDGGALSPTGGSL